MAATGSRCAGAKALAEPQNAELAAVACSPMRRLLPALGIVLGAALAAAATPVAALASPADLTLLSQTPWVGPGQTMQLRLGLSGAPLSSLQLSVSVYQHLTTRSAFAETASGTPVGAVLASTTVGADSLPVDPQGGFDLTIAVSSGDAPAAGTGTLNVDLDCSPGSCGGVYPVRLQLGPDNGPAASGVFTYLVYAHPPATTEKLRLAWLVGLSLPPSTTAGGAAAPALAAAALDELADVTGTLASHPDVPLTLAPEPASAVALAASPQPQARAVLGQLQSLALSAGRQTVAGSYVPVDAAALVSAGLGSELTDQARRGAQALSAMHAGTATWVATASMDQAALDQLASLGIDQLVVPASDVFQSPAPSLTVTSPYALSAERGLSVSTAQADTELGDDLAAGTGTGAAAAAYRFLADLALVYYEQPNDTAARGVVALDPAGAPDSAFLAVALGALSADPLVSPVTVDDLFAQVPPSTTASHHLAPGSGAGTLAARPIRAARARMSGFAGAVSTAAAPLVRALDDQLLLSEDAALRATQQGQALAAFDSALDTQLATISIRAATIKLTSTTAKVPVTLVKTSGYDVSATLEVTGDKIVFSPAAVQAPGSVCHDVTVHSSAGRAAFACQAVIDHPTNPVYIAMRARASGDFRLTISLTSPSGGLVLAQSEVTVRSVSTSLVAVGLSAAALAVLLLWWGRTVWRGGGKGRGAHVRRRPAVDDPPS